MQRIGIVAKRGERRAADAADRLASWLDQRDIEVFVEPGLGHSPAMEIDETRLADAVDLVVVLGGDGTLLAVARLIATRGVPIFPVNLGHLGFLCNADVEDLIPHMEQILAGNYTVVERLLMRGEIWRDGARLDGPWWALNDLVVHVGSVARTLTLRVTIDGFEAIPALRADGLIISSPTGSTAYNLSAGGPILSPQMQAMILAPMLPLSLSQRPLVVDGDSEVEVEYLGNLDRAFVTLDGQDKKPIVPGDRIQIRKADRPVSLIHVGDFSFFQVLRSKMGWAVKSPGTKVP